jgi:hypothetical protein
MPTETETKLELDASGAERVVGLGVVERQIDQLNVYYDDHWRLAEGRMTVRIRFVHGARPVLTAKVLRSWEGHRRTMEELEISLEGGLGGGARTAPREIDVEADLPREIAAPIRAIGCRRLQRVGWVRNQRTVVALPGAARVEVDRLRLPNGAIIFEVEIETPDHAASDRAIAMIRSAVPSAALSRMGKYERFRRALR